MTLLHANVDARHRQGGGWIIDWTWQGETPDGHPTSGSGTRTIDRDHTLAWVLRCAESFIRIQEEDTQET